MKNKINILTLGDHPLHLSGVAHCLRDICAALLQTGKFRITSLGAAIHHDDMRPIKLNTDWDVFPVEGFGTIDQVHQICRERKIDIILFQSDPRFYTWLLTKENEIRRNVPLVWYSVWDNYPYPIFNDWIWNSVDYTVAISKLTEDLVKTVSLRTNVKYQPHTVNKDLFKPLSLEESKAFRTNHLPFVKDRFLVFWNNRNGRRKNAGMLVSAFSKFANKVGRDKVCLLMKTDPVDQVGYNIPEIIRGYDAQDCIVVNAEKLPEDVLCKIYNAADATINISNNEGFGMGTLESLSCGTPIIATWTGGMREQLANNIDDPTEFFGVPLFPATKTIIGSPDLPWINEDQCSEEDLIEALLFMYEIGPEQRYNWGQRGREHVLTNFSWDGFNKFWPELLENIYDEHGSWPNTKHQKYRAEEITCLKRYESTKKPTDSPPSTFINKTHFLKFLRNSPQ